VVLKKQKAEDQAEIARLQSALAEANETIKTLQAELQEDEKVLA